MNKYRGKRIDNGEWVYGSVIKRMWDGLPDTYYITEHRVAVNGWEALLHSVLPESVGILIGWIRSPNIDLYKGDIVQYNNTEGKEYINEVRYSHSVAAWCLGSMTIKQIVESGYFQGMNLKVIGNTTDDPLLLNE